MVREIKSAVLVEVVVHTDKCGCVLDPKCVATAVTRDKTVDVVDHVPGMLTNLLGDEDR